MKKLIVGLLGWVATLAAQPAAHVGLGPVMVLVLGLAAPSAPYAAQVFSFSTIDAGGTETDPSGINLYGQIVGIVYDNSYCDQSGCYATSPHGFLKNGDTFTAFDVPGASETFAFGINDAGQIVGSFQDAAGFHGFLKDGATFTTIDVPGAYSTLAFGINGAGQIVGTFSDSTRNHGFLKDGNTFTIFDVPGADAYFEVRGINDAGQIVGWFESVTGRHSFLKDGATFTTIDVPGAYATGASGINGAGQVVGTFYPGAQGFLKDGNTFTTIDMPGALESGASGINDAGQIVGSFTVESSTLTQGFLAVPAVPTQNASPVASFTFACSQLTCNFNGSASSDSDGTITSYAWNFGDGMTGSGPTPSHAYAASATYTITLTVMDNGGATGTQSRSTVIQAFLHVGDLDRTTTNKGATWTATVTITVHDSNHSPVANATVSGSWSSGGTGSCTTSGSGQCGVSKSMIPKSTGSVTFTVVNVTHATLTYNAPDNHDADGDSNGTVITLNRP